MFSWESEARLSADLTRKHRAVCPCKRMEHSKKLTEAESEATDAWLCQCLQQTLTPFVLCLSLSLLICFPTFLPLPFIFNKQMLLLLEIELYSSCFEEWSTISIIFTTAFHPRPPVVRCDATLTLCISGCYSERQEYTWSHMMVHLVFLSLFREMQDMITFLTNIVTLQMLGRVCRSRFCLHQRFKASKLTLEPISANQCCYWVTVKDGFMFVGVCVAYELNYSWITVEAFEFTVTSTNAINVFIGFYVGALKPKACKWLI